MLVLGHLIYLHKPIVSFFQCVILSTPSQVDGNTSTLSMRIHFKSLKKLVEEPTFSEVLIPLQSVMIPTLPSVPGSHSSHDPFPGCWAYITSFGDVVSI